MAVALAGRAAEQIVFNQVTTSAAEDLEAVTATAKDMVMRFGMGRGLGARVFGSDATQPFVGRALSRPSDYSQQTARDIDDEIGRLVARAYEVATQILEPRQAQLHVMAGVLLERETLGRAEFEALLARTPVTDDGRVLRFRPRGPRLDGSRRSDLSRRMVARLTAKWPSRPMEGREGNRRPWISAWADRAPLEPKERYVAVNA